MKGVYVYLTQEGITHLRWFREPENAARHVKRWYEESGDMPHVRSDEVQEVTK